jgi:hypothetical protein
LKKKYTLKEVDPGIHVHVELKRKKKKSPVYYYPSVVGLALKAERPPLPNKYTLSRKIAGLRGFFSLSL